MRHYQFFKNGSSFNLEILNKNAIFQISKSEMTGKKLYSYQCKCEIFKITIILARNLNYILYL